jgi:hypothetical protein
MDKENWKPISGFEGLYEISDQGNLKSLRRNRLMRPSVVNDVGHLQARLSKMGTVRYAYVHRLVLEAFVGQCPPGMQCRHLNGDPSDNRLENLRWGTPSEDNYDRIRHGTHQHSSKTHCKNGHPLDGAYLRPDGTVKQRICLTCRRKHNREMKDKARLARQTCPKGHPFDGVRYKADGTLRQRYCTICVNEALARGQKTKGQRPRCPRGHEYDGVIYKPDGTVRQRICNACRRERAKKRRSPTE